MYGLYDREGILRFVNADKKACLDYAELFGISSTNFCLMDYVDNLDKESDINPAQNQVENNN